MCKTLIVGNLENDSNLCQAFFFFFFFFSHAVFWTKIILDLSCTFRLMLGLGLGLVLGQGYTQFVVLLLSGIYQ